MRVHGRQSTNRAEQSELLLCYDYVRQRFGRDPSAPSYVPESADPNTAAAPSSSPTSAQPAAPAAPTAGPAVNTSSTSNATMGNSTSAEQRAGSGATSNSASASTVPTDRSTGRRALAAAGAPDANAPSDLLDTSFAELESPTGATNELRVHIGWALPRLRASEAETLESRLQRDAEVAGRLHAALDTRYEYGHEQPATDPRAQQAEAREAYGMKRSMRRRAQQLTLEEAQRAELLLRPHYDLSEAEKIALIPEWQRNLLRGNELTQPGAFTQIQGVLAGRYTDSNCNATHGCDVRFGTCLNISRLPVHEYDQNGTCACHHWFTGGDCSQPDLSGDVCTVDDEDNNVTRRIDDTACAALRTKLYLCGHASQGDGLPQICVDRNLTALACLEAGFMRDASYTRASYASGSAAAASTSASASGSASSSSVAASSSVGAAAAVDPTDQPYLSTWLRDSARAAREHSCVTGIAQLHAEEAQTQQNPVPVIDCTQVGARASALPGWGDSIERPSSDATGADGDVTGEGASVEQSTQKGYQPNMLGHLEDAWAMSLCAKCMGRPETMTRVCRRPATLATCQRHEHSSGQSVCNMCMDDVVGNGTRASI